SLHLHTKRLFSACSRERVMQESDCTPHLFKKNEHTCVWQGTIGRKTVPSRSTNRMASRQLTLVLRHIHKIAGEQGARTLRDRQFLARSRAHADEAAFATLVPRHGPLVLGVCRRVLHSVHDADDAFQATFLVLARKAKSIRKQESVGSWLYGVAY